MYLAPNCRSSAATSHRHPRFEIHAERCPQLLPRILGLFAAQALIPSDVRARHSCAGLWLSVEVDIDPDKACRLAEKLRTMASVQAVVLICWPVFP